MVAPGTLLVNELVAGSYDAMLCHKRQQPSQPQQQRQVRFEANAAANGDAAAALLQPGAIRSSE